MAKVRNVLLWPLILIVIYSICGIIGNLIVLYVYLRKWKKNTTRVFILCLALLDLVNCAINMPFEVALVLNQTQFDHHYLCKLSKGLTYVINNTGSLVFVSVAIERYICVYYPLQSRQLTPAFAKGMCLASFLIASSVSWPSFVFYGTQTMYYPTKSVDYRYKTCLISDEHKFDKGWPLIFAIVLFALLFFVFIILIILYIAIGRKIYLATCTDLDHSQDTTNRKSASRLLSKSIISAITGVSKPEMTSDEGTSRRFSRHKADRNTTELSCRHEHSVMSESSTLSSSLPRPGSASSIKVVRHESRRFSSHRHQATRKNTVMMRMVTIAFMVSFTPFLCILLIRYTNKNYYFHLGTTGKIVYHVFLRSYFINSMVNPFIYGFMNMHFRRLVKNMLRNIFCSNCCKTDV